MAKTHGPTDSTAYWEEEGLDSAPGNLPACLELPLCHPGSGGTRNKAAVLAIWQFEHSKRLPGF